MSDKKEKYQYDFDFTNEDSKLISDALGKSDEYINKLNSKIDELLEYFKEKIHEINPSKEFMKEFSNTEEHTGSFKENVDKYLQAGRENVDSTEFLTFTDTVKLLTEKFSPEELALICANQYKHDMVEMSTLELNKDLLTMAVELDSTTEAKVKLAAFMETFMSVGADNGSTLLGNRGFTHFIISFLS